MIQHRIEEENICAIHLRLGDVVNGRGSAEKWKRPPNVQVLVDVVKQNNKDALPVEIFVGYHIAPHAGFAIRDALLCKLNA